MITLDRVDRDLNEYLENEARDYTQDADYIDMIAELNDWLDNLDFENLPTTDIANDVHFDEFDSIVRYYGYEDLDPTYILSELV